ncbi:MAG TPA: ATP-dependent helicase, partial [Solirubrobacteraceae bacterium]|nr:ATP-dependent helicase [Solirubrobacteraceae bacterium]
MFAGPGSGKTRTLTARIAALLGDGVRPREILALTFTVRATDEMRVRLVELVGQDVAHGVTVTTFHGLGARILRQHAERFGRSAQYSIYEPADLRRIVSDAIADSDDDPGDARRGLQADVVVREIAKAKCALSTPAGLRARGDDPQRDVIAALWQLVEDELRACNAFDFQDLLTHSVALLSQSPQIRNAYRRRWRHILVDEFQDTDPSQLALLLRLAGPSGCGPDGSLMVVGDDDQSCFGFRGAAVGNLLDFQRSFPCAEKRLLRRNYRCARRVLAAATRCIAHNAQREPKALVTRGGAPDGAVALRRFASDRAEAAAIAGEIAAQRDDGVDLREIAVLCRTLRYTQPLQQALTARAVAHRVIGGHSLWERVEVQDALAHLALIANPHDQQAFRRAIGAPTDREQFRVAQVKAPSRGVGTKTQAQVVRHARATGIDLLRASADADMP